MKNKNYNYEHLISDSLWNGVISLDYNMDNVMDNLSYDKMISCVNDVYNIDINSLVDMKFLSDVDSKIKWAKMTRGERIPYMKSLLKNKRIERNIIQANVALKYSSIVPITVTSGAGFFYLNDLQLSGMEDSIWNLISGLYGLLNVTCLGLYSKYVHDKTKGNRERLNDISRKIEKYEKEIESF